MTGAQYHPLASTSNDPLYVPFGFMKILQGDVELGRRIRGREPDVVLAIHDKNDPARPAKLVPVQYVKLHSGLITLTRLRKDEN